MDKKSSATDHVREKALRKRQNRNKIERAAQEAVRRRAEIIAAFLKPHAITPELLTEAIGGKVPSYDSYRDPQHPFQHLSKLKEICEKRPSKERAEFGELILFLFKRAPKLLNAKYLRALWRMYALGYWLRPLEEWKPRGYNEDKLYRGLVDHLYAKYPMPTFLYSAFNNSDNEALLFVHLAQGGSVVGAVKTKLLPTVMTTRMCHLFMQQDADTIVRAVRAAQVQAYGGSNRLAYTVGRTFLGESFQGALEDFWLTVLQWLCAQAMLDPVKVGPLLDYIRHRQAATPTFTMKGRSVLVLLREMEAWHKELAAKKILRSEVFLPSGLQPGEWDLSRRDEHDNVLAFNIWTMKEILSSKELQAEGRAMHHCVFSYAHAVQSGRTSIWSLSCNGEKRLTVSVSNESRRITEARGLQNRPPTIEEANMVHRWGGQNGLDASYYR